MEEVVNENQAEIEKFIKALINELSFVTFAMIILIIAVALLMSGYLSRKIEKILIGTKRFSNNELDYRIKVNSNDEIGQLENSFNALNKGIIVDEEVSFNDFVKINGMYDNASMLIPMLVSPFYYPSLTKIRSFLVKENDYFNFVMKDWRSFCKYNYLNRYSDAAKCNMTSLDFSAKWN